MALDDFDRRILSLYQHDTRIPGERIGTAVGLSAAAVQRRIKRMRDDGVIVADQALVDRRKVGLGFTAIVGVDLIDESGRAMQAFRDRVAPRDEVQQCYGVTGEADFVLMVVVADLDAYERFCEACLLHDPNVQGFTTQVVLDAAKVGATLRIPGAT